MNYTALYSAVALIALVTAAMVVLAKRHSITPPASAAYAANLELTNEQMSESTSLSGGKSTYIDGHIANKGAATVTGVTVQVSFANDVAMPPQVETLPLTLIRMREPYIDTEPVSAAPLGPGAEADFRLIFEDIHDNWNQQTPAVRVVGVTTR